MSRVFTLLNVDSFYAADTVKGEIEIVVNWLFRNRICSTAHPLATHIGLEAGENALDVIIADAFTLEILMPSMNGMSGRTPILNQKFYERQNEHLCTD